jgi:uncharacterized protein YggE
MIERAAAQPATIPTVAVTTSTVSAIGVGYVPVSTQPPQAQALTLNLAVHERITAADTRSALQALRAKLGALTVALGRVGIPASAVHIGNLFVAPVYSLAPGSSGSGGGSQSIQGYMITENVQVDISGTEQLADGIQVGLEAGATSMNASTRGVAQAAATPDSAIVDPAVAQATVDAKALAQAVAQSAGIRLGSVHTVAVASPLLIFVAPGVSAWRVQVTFSYAIAGSSP